MKTSTRWIRPRLGLVAFLVFAAVVGYSAMQPRLHQARFVLMTAADSGGAGGLELGAIAGGAFPANLLGGGGAGELQLRRIQMLARSEALFLDMLRENPRASRMLKLTASSTMEDSIAAYDDFTQRVVSTSLDSPSGTLGSHGACPGQGGSFDSRVVVAGRPDPQSERDSDSSESGANELPRRADRDC